MPDADPTAAALDTFDAAQSRNDATRDLPMATLHFVPPLAAYDIHAKLVEEIRLAHSASSVDDWFNGRESGLRTAYRIVFGKNAP